MVTRKPRKLSNKQIIPKRKLRQRRRKPRTLYEVCVFAYQQVHKNVSGIKLKKYRKLVEKYHLRSNFFLLLLIIGLSLSLWSVFYYTYSKTVLSFQASPVLTLDETLRTSEPEQIILPNNNVGMKLNPAQIVDGIWQISDNTASHLINSANPGERGNIVIYGHNKKHIFGNLHQLEENDVVAVLNADGTKHEYKVRDIKVVEPSAIEEVAPTDHEVLTLFTCTGFMDSKRLVIKAYPYRVSSS